MPEWHSDSRCQPLNPARSSRAASAGSTACSPTACCTTASRSGGRRSPSSALLLDLQPGPQPGPEQASIAKRHGRGVQHLQDALHLNFERSLNRFVAAHEPVAQVMNYYYATLHFVVTIGCLVWLFRAHPRIYRGARTILFATSLIALAGFYLYPLAPPRLLPQYGYVDTLLKFHTWGSLADPKIAEHSNQYAAMPSLHIGWALWCGVAIYLCARRPLGAGAGPDLPGVHPAGHRRHRQPLRHRRRRRARGVRPAARCSTCSPAAAPSSRPRSAGNCQHAEPAAGREQTACAWPATSPGSALEPAGAASPGGQQSAGRAALSRPGRRTPTRPPGGPGG